jgi:hypothetical protein
MGAILRLPTGSIQSHARLYESRLDAACLAEDVCSAPGVGKKLSAFHYSRSEMIVSFDRWTSLSRGQLPINTILHTTAVINTPSRNESDIGMAHDRLMGITMNPIRVKAKEVLFTISLRDEASRREILNKTWILSM